MRISRARPTAGQHRTTGQVALSGRQVPTFHARAKTTLAPPPRRTPPGQSTGTRQAHPGAPKHPRFRCQPSLTTRHQWFACARLRDPHLPRSRRDFPPTLTTTALDRSSSGWFAASACTAAAEGHHDNNARLLHLLHSTESSDLISYIQPPSTFVAHPRTSCERAVGARGNDRNYR